jgi:hypothetical protein
VLIQENGEWGLPLDRLVERVGASAAVYRGDIRPGDLLEVQTVNSRYTIRSLGGGRYRVTGGWFDRTNGGPAEVSIKGCTWGGSSIMVDVIAVCGLCIEFGNRIVTSAVQRIVLLPQEIAN